MSEARDPRPDGHLLQGIVEGVPIRVFWKDRECRYLGCNTLFARDAGRERPGDLIGRTDFDLAWKDQAERNRAEDLRVMESGEPRLGFEEPQSMPDGRTLWLRKSKVPLRDDAGEVCGVLGIYEDVTERRRIEGALRDSRERHRRAQRIARVGHWQLDLRTGQLEWSDEIYRIFEIDRRKFGGSYEEFVEAIHPDDRLAVDRAYGASLESRQPYHIEHRLLMKDGRIKWVEEHGETSYDEDGKPVLSAGTVHDITERKEFEDRLAASEARSRAVIDQSPLAIRILSPDGRTRQVNPAWEEMWGETLGELAEDNVLLDPWIVERGLPDLVRKAFDGEAMVIPEMPYERRRAPARGEDGEPNWVHTFLYPLVDERHRVREVVLIQEDTTARRRTLAALERSEGRFRDLFENSPDPCWIINGDNLFAFCNQAAAEMLGYDSIEELRSTHPSKLSPETQPDGQDSFGKANEMMALAHKHGVHRFEWEHRRRSGECFPVEVTLARIGIGGKDHLYCVWRDITQRKATEEALRSTSDFLGEIIGNAAEGVAVCRPSGEFPFLRFELWNERMTEITGYTMDEINRIGWLQSMYADDEARERARRRMKRMGRGESSLDEEREIITKSGERKSLLISASSIARADGTESIIALIHDVTERKRAERDLRLAKFVMDNAPFNITCADADARIRYLNKAGWEALGYAEEEARDLTIPDIDPFVSSDSWARHWKELKSRRSLQFETLHRRKAGDVFPVEVSANYMEFGDEALNVAFDQDVTERRQLEEQLRQSQKMEAIGTLVGGIAHDFNNLLAAIQGNVYLARRQLKDHPLALEKMGHIEKLTSNAAAMVRQLLTFARKDTVALETFRLNPFLKECLELIRTAIPENIELESVLCEETLSIEGDATQLQQVLMNLVNNARDAAGGTSAPRIRCAVNRVVADEEFRQRHPEATAREFACISVEDNGHGIASSDLDRIFDPFFTTKDVGEGTGLGLAMVYGCIRSHAGVIELESELGVGTTFRILLPLSGKDAPGRNPGKDEVAPGRGETILLVDDDDDMRSTTADVLDCLGYRVVEAVNGRDALERLERDGRAIDLMVSDVVMPIMGGADLVQVVRRIRPDLPVILATGYERNDNLDELARLHLVRVLSKPFAIAAISRLIRGMLEESGAGTG
ncbi:PAS domain S-box protein [bacterium]|nr:PAS domain S-box protein [bacterium]